MMTVAASGFGVVRAAGARDGSESVVRGSHCRRVLLGSLLGRFLMPVMSRFRKKRNIDQDAHSTMPPKGSKKPAAFVKPLPAQGKGQKKRTPQSAFDAAAGKDIYEPEKIVAQRIAKGGIGGRPAGEGGGRSLELRCSQECRAHAGGGAADA